MKLVLLPGMDGTGILFEALLSELSNMDVLSLPLPKDGPQDYESLSAYVAKHLPKEDFILVAESFSGGIAATLSTKNYSHMKAIIFVASFLSAPKKLIAYFASFLPLRALSHLPFSSIVHRFLFLGKTADTAEIKRFRCAIKSVPSSVLKSRLRVIAKSQYSGFKSSLPAVYIGATSDMLVSSNKREEFKEAYREITFAELKGPHFILQAQPQVGAAAIIKAAHLLTSQYSSQSSVAVTPQSGSHN